MLCLVLKKGGALCFMAKHFHFGHVFQRTLLQRSCGLFRCLFCFLQFIWVLDGLTLESEFAGKTVELLNAPDQQTPITSFMEVLALVWWSTSQVHLISSCKDVFTGLHRVTWKLFFFTEYLAVFELSICWLNIQNVNVIAVLGVITCDCFYFCILKTPHSLYKMLMLAEVAKQGLYSVKPFKVSLPTSLKAHVNTFLPILLVSHDSFLNFLFFLR